ncbi:MAG: hypothetical protein NC898_06315 [Candidatus Omnitrophica bacterium]|nr:hypothetical protein [Candidatus Omnitrophota bacterium]
MQIKHQTHKKNRKKLMDSASLLCEGFIFNLGRLWEEVISENWDGALYIYNLIEEVSPPSIKEKYSDELKRLQISIKEKSYENVDKILTRILKW